MLGSTHFIAGAAIGKATGNPILAIVFGLIAHFLMDLVPHFDYGYFFKKNVRSFLIAISDPFAGLVVFILIAYFKGFSQQDIVNSLIGGLACILPDVLGVGIKLFKIKKLKFFSYFHERLHWFIKDKFDPFEWKKGWITKKGIVWGIAYQIPFIAVSIYFLIRL